MARAYSAEVTHIGAGALPLHVRTTPLDSPQALLPLTDPKRPLLWQREGAGLSGRGEVLRLEFSGPDRLREAATTWRTLCASALVHDSVGLPGTGLIAFGAFAFSGGSTATSVLIVPRTVIGTRDGKSWLTRIAVTGATFAEAPSEHPSGGNYRVPLTPGAMTPDSYRAAVISAIAAIRAGELSKVVIARDLRGQLPAEVDLRRLLRSLADGYPECWTFAVDGFLGASPETLVAVDQGAVWARVLAGTAARGTDADADDAVAAALVASMKDRSEHAFALASLMRELKPHTRELTADAAPFPLRLPNLWHLATDVRGVLGDTSTTLDLVRALHPTAAVAGTPTADALSLIGQLEPFDRGRYAGPVGWIDGSGDGEWAVGLRSAEVTAKGSLTAWAGAGIVADSDPESELAETQMKFRPIVDALS
ncbi:isochorismate synthase [Rathayibacter rathayi]|nr:isochorismate synthase [Rathayibacter rathayi]PPG94759.1 isochorismate synthase [Rathayibacter rathayi]